MNMHCVEGAQKAVSQIVVDDVLYQVCELEETAEFAILGETECIGYATACYMTCNINVYKINPDGKDIYCGDIEMPEDDEIDAVVLSRKCIELLISN